MIISKQVVSVFSFSVAKNSVNLSKNYYKILEVDTTCDQKIIKKSYLKLVKALHPDVNPNGKQKFTQVQQAYQVLSDQQLKTYYDKNNYSKNGNPNTTQSNQQKYSAQSKTYQSNTGHRYYTHRTYASQNPNDYFYSDNQPKKQKAQSENKNRNRNEYDEDDEDDMHNKRNTKFDRDDKRARSQAAWEQYMRQKQQYQAKEHPRETPQQRKMRDRLKAMRGFTSSHNVLWARHHIRHSDILNKQQRQKRKQEQIRSLMPQKVRKFYDKLMQKIQKLAEQ